MNKYVSSKEIIKNSGMKSLTLSPIVSSRLPSSNTTSSSCCDSKNANKSIVLTDLGILTFVIFVS